MKKSDSALIRAVELRQEGALKQIIEQVEAGDAQARRVAAGLLKVSNRRVEAALLKRFQSHSMLAGELICQCFYGYAEILVKNHLQAKSPDKKNVDPVVVANLVNEYFAELVSNADNLSSLCSIKGQIYQGIMRMLASKEQAVAANPSMRPMKQGSGELDSQFKAFLSEESPKAQSSQSEASTSGLPKPALQRISQAVLSQQGKRLAALLPKLEAANAQAYQAFVAHYFAKRSFAQLVEDLEAPSYEAVGHLLLQAFQFIGASFAESKGESNN